MASTERKLAKRKKRKVRSTINKKNPKNQKNHQSVNASAIRAWNASAIAVREYEYEKSEKTRKIIRAWMRVRSERVRLRVRARPSTVVRILWSIGLLSALLLYCPPYIYIYDSLSIGASGCNRLKGHIYICVCAFFLHRYIFYSSDPHLSPWGARRTSLLRREKNVKNMTWPFRAYLPVLAPALMLLLPTAPAPLTSHLTQLNNSWPTPQKSIHFLPQKHISS